MKKLLKLFRRWRYRKLLHQIDRRNPFMCINMTETFPFIPIKFYPELWDRRPPHKFVWFYEHENRKKFIEEAIKMTES